MVALTASDFVGFAPPFRSQAKTIRVTTRSYFISVQSLAVLLDGLVGVWVVRAPRAVEADLAQLAGVVIVIVARHAATQALVGSPREKDHVGKDGGVTLGADVTRRAQGVVPLAHAVLATGRTGRLQQTTRCEHKQTSQRAEHDRVSCPHTVAQAQQVGTLSSPLNSRALTARHAAARSTTHKCQAAIAASGCWRMLMGSNVQQLVLPWPVHCLL